ncbi:MAG: hypothetical protein L3K06_05935, partial [Thermoplasmata archaeon]|nr:hypothetical protein [Thermoplasmata archaeon]
MFLIGISVTSWGPVAIVRTSWVGRPGSRAARRQPGGGYLGSPSDAATARSPATSALVEEPAVPLDR